MILTKLTRAVFFALLCAAVAVVFTQPVFAQDTNQSTRTAAKDRDEETNLDTQLDLILATNQPVEEGRIPAYLEPVIKQLRETLPFKHYTVASSMLNRVKNGGHLNLRWIGGPLSGGSSSAHTPSFSEFGIDQVKVMTDADGRLVVYMRGFNFGSRIPIQTSTNIASTGTMSAPVFSYEPTGLHTDISVREDAPVVVGTLNVGPSGDAIVVVVSAKRSPK
jgi:hypothetical protein